MLESENCDDASIFLIPSMWKDWPSTEGDASSGIPRCKVDPDTSGKCGRRWEVCPKFLTKVSIMIAGDSGTDIIVMFVPPLNRHLP